MSNNHVSNPGGPPVATDLAVTRVANACVLLELNGHTILTDPWFTERWYLRRGEPLGLRVIDLQALTAIVATNFAVNHWDLRALRDYRHKATTPVYVSAARMARQARALGFRTVEHLGWGETRDLAPALSIEAVPAGRTLAWRNNAYVLTSGRTRVLFGGEIQDVALLERYRAHGSPVAVALLPVNGLRPVLGRPLVMGPREAVAGARAVGARVLVPVHDAHGADPLSLVFRRHGSGEDARALAATDRTGLEVVCLVPGERWEYSTAGAG
ncbi:MBL fold metallo-hydrolase [Pseudonocardia xinjiangensis]|uniref:MBL fold metallo-hydrolase n=1 Tax=Pseudonocardia xinjiangensis TaxID=75289 RepID=UPI003D9248C1